MALGLLDLSIVTDRLLDHLRDARQATALWAENTPPAGPVAMPFTIFFTGLPPDAIRSIDGCTVSLYLFHVAPDKFHRNTFPTGGHPHTIPEQPFALTLYYLLSAHSASFIEEQQAMSIALKCLHEKPIASAMVPADKRIQEFCLSIEPETVDDIGRLWQAMATPLRLSAVFRASVLFLEPKAPAVYDPKPVVEPHVTAVVLSPPPAPTIATGTATNMGLVTITGTHFDIPEMTVVIGARVFTPTATNPPEPGRCRIVSATELELQLPKFLPGKYMVRIRVANEPAAEIAVKVP